VNSDLKRELERRVPDSEIPPLPLERVKQRGRRLMWRRRFSIAGSGLLAVAVIIGVSALILRADEPAPTAVPAGEPSGAGAKDDSVVSLIPDRVRSGDSAVLRVERSPGVWGLAWHLERLEDSTWKWIGGLVAGPGDDRDARFYLGPDAANIGVDDLGFTADASIAIEIPKLESGKYRLGQDFEVQGSGSPEDRTRWHYAEFEVLD
jgi:hypothetical protein